MTAVLIVDQRFLVRQGLKQIIAQECRDVLFGEARNPAELSAQVRRRRWNLAVVQIGNSHSALTEIRLYSRDCRVLVLSSQEDAQEVSRAIEMGAAGYLPESADRLILVKALKTLLGGGTYFTDTPRAMSEIPTHASLSAREMEIMLAVAQGKRSREIAAELDISIQTVSTYKHRVLDKMGFTSMAELIRYVIDCKLC